MNPKFSDADEQKATSIETPCVLCGGKGTREVNLASSGGVMMTACEACHGKGFAPKPPTYESPSSDPHNKSRWADGCVQLAIFAPFILGGYLLHRFLPDGFPLYLVFVLGPWWVLVPVLLTVEVLFRKRVSKMAALMQRVRSFSALPLVLLSICGVTGAAITGQFPFDILAAVGDWADGGLWIVVVGPASIFGLFFLLVLLPYGGPWLFRRLLGIKEPEEQEK